jgi:transcriptional regulator with XRE-family HTH domain
MKEGRAVSDKFGATLLYYRQQKGLSLRDLESLTSISQSYLNRLEKGERKSPGVGISSKIAKALGIPLTTLLDISTKDVPAEEAQTISELLLYNDFKIVEDKVISKEAKQILVEIIEFIITCVWNEETKIGDILELSELIQDFKEEMKA